MSNTGTSFLGKFSLLTWKNWQVAWYHRVEMLISLLTPSVFAIILIFMRFSINVNNVGYARYDNIFPESQWRRTIEQVVETHEKLAQHGVTMYNCFIPQVIVAYAPNNTMYTELMKLASSDYLNNIELKGFRTVKEMRSAMMTEHFFAGIGFNNVPYVNVNEKITTETVNTTLNLNFSLVFPSELRFFNETFIGQSWRSTEKHNHEFLNRGERKDFDVYVREGFISLQHAVSMAFIKSVVADKNLSIILMSRFPRIEHKFDPFINKAQNSISLVLLAGYLYPCVHLAKRMLREREHKLTRVLENLGISETINFLSWFVRGFVTLIVGSVLVLAILKIKWHDGFGVFTVSSWSTLYYFLFCYNIASVTFCYFISSMVNTTSAGVVLVTFFWLLTYMPFPAYKTLEVEGIMIKITSLFLSNTAMGIGFDEINIFEENGEGLQWNNMFKKATPYSVWSVGALGSILLFNSIIYTILGVYINSTKRSLDFLTDKLIALVCSRTYYNLRSQPSFRSLLNNRKSKIFAIENEDKRVMIELKNLTKIYNGNPVIEKVSMNIYQGEITVIMGHNGAGKSTLLSMVAGFIRPTSGTTIFEGMNLRKRSIHGLNMGVCLHHIIFPDLTVASNIIFYSRLKGLKSSAVQKEVKKYLDAMNLNSLSNVLACNLSNGLKQNLSICCALCGNSKYVILDEPSANMDAVARKRLWQLLISEKNDRTIIVTTNSTEEAEVLGDRLAILSGGLLMCFGTPFFLKTIYGRGYRLICLKNPYCDSETVTAFLKSHIPSITTESEIGIELSYRLSEGYAAVLPKLLLDLEESSDQLNISSCAISEPCIEDIFLRLGAEDPGEDNRFRQNEIMNGLSIYTEEYEKLNLMHTYQSYTGFKLVLSQVSAMIWKRHIYNKRKKATLLQYIMPATVIFLTFILTESRDIRRQLIPETIRMTAFPESLTAVAGPRSNVTEIESQRYNLFKQYFETLPYLSVVHKVHSIEDRTFTNYITKMQREGLTFNKKYIVGASYDVYKGSIYYIIAWYNNYYLHTAPLSLNFAHNGFLASRMHKGRITVTHDPLPFTTDLDPNDIHVNSFAGNFLPINLTIIILIVYTSVLLFLIRERNTRFKLRQFIYGMRNVSFWLGSGVYDFVRIMLISLIVFVMIIIFEHSTYEHYLSAIHHFFILVLFGTCMTPCYYLVSMFFRDNSTGFIIITFVNIYGVVAFCSALQILSQTNIDSNMPFGYTLLTYIVPYLSLSSALTKLFCIDRIFRVCKIDEIKNVSILVDNCLTEPTCCIEPRLFAWNYLGVLPEISYFIILWLLCTLLLIAQDYRKNLKNLFGFTILTDNEKLAFEDYELKHAEDTAFQDELVNETFRVETMKEGNYRNQPLVMSNLSKIYGEKVAVNRMTLLLERCECFGLLGVNGAGKSTVLKMLVGDEEMTCGRAHVDGASLTDDIYRMYKRVGYCPYSQYVPINMTCHELLSFFCLLRGIHRHHIAEITDCLLKVFGIIKQYDREIIYVSSGLRRRLSLAIALIGNPSILYIDGNSVNVDPAGRRQIWNIICRMCALGKTVMLTTHNALDCERFCTRFGVISNGRMICLDTVYNLQNKYIQGYILQVKVKVPSKHKKSQGSASVSSSNPYLKVMSFVENEFPNSTVSWDLLLLFVFMPSLGVIEKISVIFLKNWKAFWVLRYMMALSILTPSLFISILVAMRFTSRVHYRDLAIYQPINTEEVWIKMMQQISANQAKLANQGIFLHNCFLPQLIVAYAPNSTIYNQLMTSASTEYLNNINLISFQSDTELRAAMKKEYFLAGVLFNHDKNIKREPKFKLNHNDQFFNELFNLDFTLIFPSELRFFGNDFIGQSWRTNMLKVPFAELDEHNSTENEEYVREGFLSLQNAVSMAFIRRLGVEDTLPKININKFPRIAHVTDPIMKHLSYSLPFLIVVGYFSPLVRFSMRIVNEKVFLRKKILKILGISRIIHTISWLLWGYVILLFGSIFVLIIIKIGWADGFGICSYSSWLALYFFFTCYNIASICFCFMASSMVRSVPNVMVVVGIFWIVSYLPYMASLTHSSLGIMKMVFSHIFSNSVMGFGFSNIVDLEKNGEGLQWQNLFERPDDDENLSVGAQSSILLGLSIIYTILGLSLYKVPILFKKLKERLFTCQTEPTENRLSSSPSYFRKTKVLEIQAVDKNVIIDVKNLTKEYQGRKVIDDVSLSIYEGEISVIMGHNGSGKTTLLMMIAGLIHPTSGSASFNGENMTKLSGEGFNIGIGVENMLNPDLTVADHIMLYCRLKGLKGINAKEDVEKYLSAMNLHNVANVLTRNLTDGLKRHLIVCCALCGDSKIVVLDEPSTGMDSIAKGKFWDLILSEKTNRTILISTHSVQEAEILGDHLMILSSGELMCYGSAYFLKSLYGRGYRLVCMKTPQCDSSNVTAFLRNYITHISPESDIGMELSYRLQERYSVIFPKLLADLEEEFYKLEISGCCISEPTVEDIVLVMGSEDSTETERFRHSDVMQGHTIYAEEYKNYTFMQEYTAYRGFKLFFIQLHAMVLKHFNNNKLYTKVLLYFLLPAVVTLLTFLISDPRFGGVLQPITFRMTQYPESVTAVSGKQVPDFNQQRYNLFLQYLDDLPSLSVVHKLEIVRSHNFVAHILEKQSSEVDFNKKYLVGVSYENEEITAWFNNYLLHTAPLSLNLVHNGLLASIQHSGRITVTHDPLPISSLEDLPDLRTSTHIGNLLAMIISYIICFIYSYLVLFAINERETRFKLVQFICGIRHITFYLGAFLYDISKVMVISLSVIIVIFLYNDKIHDQNKSAVYCFLIMIVFGICITPFYYLVSLIFKNANLGFWLISIFNIFSVSGFVALVEWVDSSRITQLELSTPFKLLSYLFPHFVLCESLTKIFGIGKARFICKNKDIHIVSVKLDECKIPPNCCIDPKELEWNYWGILPDLCYFLIIGLLSTILLFIYEFRNYIKRYLGFSIPLDNSNLFLEQYKRSHDDTNEYQKDIINEHLRVEYLKKADYRKKSLVMSNVSKIYDKKVAVNRMTLLVERGECFGLLGINGSGKSTVQKMLVGDESFTCGRAYVHGISLIDDMFAVYKHIGYCPNFLSAPTDMTCRQMVEFFCRLRGIPLKSIGEISEGLAKVLGLMKNFDKLIGITSPGIRRRLSTMITLIGNPSILYFDEHTAGIDPAGRRQMWNIISRMHRLGNTIILTAHDPSESEHFCTRIGIINKGSMICLDHVYHLQTRYIKAYILQVKLKTSRTDDGLVDMLSSTSSQRLSFSSQMFRIRNFMENVFPNSTLRYQHGAFISFTIPSENTSVSQIFKKMKRKAYSLKIENFSVTWETLSLLLTELVDRENN